MFYSLPLQLLHVRRDHNIFQTRSIVSIVGIIIEQKKRSHRSEPTLNHFHVHMNLYFRFGD